MQLQQIPYIFIVLWPRQIIYKALSAEYYGKSRVRDECLNTDNNNLLANYIIMDIILFYSNSCGIGRLNILCYIRFYAVMHDVSRIIE